jgi:nucleoside-diphosphate-sugar epimerase
MSIRHNYSQPVNPRRVVVLGSSGFVGGDLVAHLQALQIPNLGLSSRDLNLLADDSAARLGRLVRSDDALVLVSALTPDRGKDVATLMRNLKMGEHVSTFLEKTRIAHFVYIGSDAVYPDNANPVRETTPCHPGSFHGLMHLAREMMLTLAAAKTRTPCLFLRPCAIYGAADTHNSYGPNRFLHSARKEAKITLFGQGEEKRDHLYVRDLTRLIILGLQHQSEGILNAATGTSISFWDLAQRVTQRCHHPVRVECLPRGSPITHRHFDISATVQAFPSFRFTDLADGLAESIAEAAGRAAA